MTPLIDSADRRRAAVVVGVVVVALVPVGHGRAVQHDAEDAIPADRLDRALTTVDTASTSALTTSTAPSTMRGEQVRVGQQATGGVSMMTQSNASRASCDHAAHAVRREAGHRIASSAGRPAESPAAATPVQRKLRLGNRHQPFTQADGGWSPCPSRCIRTVREEGAEIWVT